MNEFIILETLSLLGISRSNALLAKYALLISMNGLCHASVLGSFKSGWSDTDSLRVKGLKASFRLRGLGLKGLKGDFSLRRRGVVVVSSLLISRPCNPYIIIMCKCMCLCMDNTCIHLSI
jgi:hypothetical protein